MVETASGPFSPAKARLLCLELPEKVTRFTARSGFRLIYRVLANPKKRSSGVIARWIVLKRI